MLRAIKEYEKKAAFLKGNRAKVIRECSLASEAIQQDFDDKAIAHLEAALESAKKCKSVKVYRPKRIRGREIVEVDPAIRLTLKR